MSQRSSYDAVIIGSGFGGAVMALRLAQAGQRVCVLERGRRWAKEDFPRTPQQFLACQWTRRREGLFDFGFGGQMETLRASGVGGGSLIYANVQVRAPVQAFHRAWPEAIDRTQLDPYYDLVAGMLQPAPVNTELPKSQAMEEIARRLGRQSGLMKLDLAVHFGAEDKIVDDPYRRGGPPQGTCTYCGGCVLGCHRHAKNTLDLSYLWLAEHRYGTEILPLHEAGRIEPAGNGFRVWTWRRQRGRREEAAVQGKIVILAAGALGSTELLLRCKRAGSLPRLSDALGLHFSGNGDLQAGLLGISGRVPVNSVLGPTITRAIEFPDHHVFLEEGGIPPEFAGVMAYLYSPANALASWIGARLGRRSTPGLRKLLSGLWRGGTPLDREMILLIIGRDAADGKLRLSRTGRLQAQWNNERSRPLYAAVEEIVEQAARALEAAPFFTARWALLRKLVTVHPLGGCAMANDRTGGVVDHRGEVFAYPGLYVADGSVIPVALGRNPAMTIAALAERTAFWMLHGREMATNDPRAPRNA